MKLWLRIAFLFTLSSLAVRAQQAPIPAPLLNAKTVFVSNAGSDSGLFPHPFTGAQSRGYDQFYAGLKAWNRYTLTDTPAAADLVFELQLIAPNGPSSGNKVNGASDPLPMFRLTIYDRGTHVTLWAQTSSIFPANKQKTHDKNFDDALNQLVTDLRSVLKQ